MELPRGNFNFVSFILNGLGNELNESINEETDNGPKRASKEFIDSLEEIEIKEKNQTCSICLDDFELGEKCLQLPCKNHKHLFHSEKENCMGIKKWLEKSNTCPVCRTEFTHETTTQVEDNPDNPDNPDIINQNIHINLDGIDNRMRQLMSNILINNIRVLSPQEVIEMEEQRQLEEAIQASLEEQ